MTPADLFELRKVVVAMEALKSGDFDKELQKMEEAAQASVEAASAEASKIMQQANQYLDTVQTKTKALQDAVDKSREDLKIAREEFAIDQAASRENLESLRISARAEQQELEREKVAHAGRVAEMAPRLADIAKREEQLTNDEADIVAQRSDLSDKLARLRSLSV